MIPLGLAGAEAQLLIWFLAMIRPGAALLAAPLFGSSAVPVQVRIILSLAVGIPAASASGMVVPPEGAISVAGFMLIAGEVILGLGLGFAIQIGFAAALIAGEAIGNAMGLGFASMQDPMSGHSSTAVGQFLNMVATALFLCVGGHLALIEIVVTSFKTMPPGHSWLTAEAIRGILEFGGLMFAAGLSIALPVAFALVMVQIVMGTITRSAPTLNLFAVGIPATVLAGIALLAIAMPVMADAIEHALRLGIDQSRLLAGL
ncbi:MAG: flagellar biosynthetic protein FliR [Pseudomonadota bacterium]